MRRRRAERDEAAASVLTGIRGVMGLLGPPHEMTADERAAVAEHWAKYEAERCPVCGCHPSEHGEC